MFYWVLKCQILAAALRSIWVKSANKKTDAATHLDCLLYVSRLWFNSVLVTYFEVRWFAQRYSDLVIDIHTHTPACCVHCRISIKTGIQTKYFKNTVVVVISTNTSLKQTAFNALNTCKLAKFFGRWMEPQNHKWTYLHLLHKNNICPLVVKFKQHFFDVTLKP